MATCSLRLVDRLGKIVEREECLEIGGAPPDVSDVRHDQVLRFVPQQARSRHAAEEGHLIVRSVEPDEDWSWATWIR